MTVLIQVDVPGQTKEGYEALFNRVRPQLGRASGFVSHAAYPVPGGWRIVEVWKDVEDANRFFVAAIAPRLAPGIRPKRQVVDLHNFATRAP